MREVCFVSIDPNDILQAACNATLAVCLKFGHVYKDVGVQDGAGYKVLMRAWIVMIAQGAGVVIRYAKFSTVLAYLFQEASRTEINDSIPVRVGSLLLFLLLNDSSASGDCRLYFSKVHQFYLEVVMFLIHSHDVPDMAHCHDLLKVGTLNRRIAQDRT